MDVAVGATIAKIAEKVLTILLGDKKGRKFLLYTICIALFIVCIPLITMLGMFGWMAGSDGSIFYQDKLSLFHQEELNAMYEVYDNISEVFEARGLDVADHRKASSIYFSYLSKTKQQDDVYERLAVCFLETTAEKDVYDLVSETFQVEIPANSRGKMDRFYGITPIRVTKETTGEAESYSPEPSS